MNCKILTLSLVSILSFGALVGCSSSSNDDPNIQENNDQNNPTDNKFTGTLATGPKLPDGTKGVAIRYTRKDKKYDDRGLWLWENNGGEGKEYTFDTVDDFGAVLFKPLTEWSKDITTSGLGIITKKLGSWEGQSSDMILNFSSYKTDKDGYYNVFIREGESNLFDNPDLKYDDAFKEALLVTPTKLFFETTNKISSYKIYKNNEVIDEKTGLDVNYSNYIFEGNALDITADYFVEVTFKETNKTLKIKVSKRKLYNSEAFNNAYYYDGELGAIYTKESTTFRVWSPFATSMKLRIYESGTPKKIDATKGNDNFVEHEMKKGEKGTFEIKLNGDFSGKYYTYLVTNGTYTNKEVVDPYAKSTGVNGLRGMVVDFSKTNPAGWENVSVKPYKRTELVIYETHVADVTSSSTWGGTQENAKKYTGLIEPNTTYTEKEKTVKTGFDHIKDLGINALQLIPIYDQANDELATDDKAFNWGYNPLNYNSLDGIYSKNPFDGYEKIKEFKEVVKSYNEAGVNIIMDVVYNHVADAKGSNFEALMPEYYFRYSGNNLSNGSGCGNEFASENKMARKFIVDSTYFWAKEYKLGGFRFDLMALIDLETMNTLTAKLHKEVDPNIFVHGEPWTGGSSALPGNNQASQANMSKFEGYGSFNDKFRDALIKGGLSDVTDKGWATNTTSSNASDYNLVKSGLAGKTGTTELDPMKATNYVTCHDNYTLYDRIKETKFAGSDEEIAKMATLANATVLTSQGTSFILAGEEMLRTKGGDGNSYDSGYKVNEMDYSRLIKFEELHQNYKKLINFKTKTPGLHYTTKEDIKANVVFSRENDKYSVIDYTVTDGATKYRIIHANANATEKEIDLSTYDVLIDTSNKVIKDASKYQLTKNQTLVLKVK